MLGTVRLATLLKSNRVVFLIYYSKFVIYRGNESMKICKILIIYYFLAIQCKLNLCSKCYSSENLHQNVR